MDLLEKGSRGLSGPYSGVSSEAERGSGCFSALSTLGDVGVRDCGGELGAVES